MKMNQLKRHAVPVLTGVCLLLATAANAAKPNKVEVCHIKSVEPLVTKAISIAEQGVQAHINNHDDWLVGDEVCDDIIDNSCDGVAGSQEENDASCDDDNFLTEDSCDVNNECFNDFCPVDINCDDGDSTTLDSCEAGVGCTHELIDFCPVGINCDDEDSNTDDSCMEGVGCVHEPISPSSCPCSEIFENAIEVYEAMADLTLIRPTESNNGCSSDEFATTRGYRNGAFVFDETYLHMSVFANSVGYTCDASVDGFLLDQQPPFFEFLDVATPAQFDACVTEIDSYLTCP